MVKIVPVLPSVPKPRAPYSAAIEANGLVFISGQVGYDPESESQVETAAQTRLAMERIGTILNDMGLGYGDLVKTTVFLTDIDDFGTVNEVYAAFFESDPPARSTIQVAALPRPQLKIEIEAIAVR
jgi:2-iminobutanoate/2-iminopropanoate deaminase